jgi:hypothetical protein
MPRSSRGKVKGRGETLPSIRHPAPSPRSVTPAKAGALLSFHTMASQTFTSPGLDQGVLFHRRQGCVRSEARGPRPKRGPSFRWGDGNTWEDPRALQKKTIARTKILLDFVPTVGYTPVTPPNRGPAHDGELGRGGGQACGRRLTWAQLPGAEEGTRGHYDPRAYGQRAAVF